MGTLFLPRVSCVLLLGSSVSLYSGQLGDRPHRIRDDWQIWVRLVPCLGGKQVYSVLAKLGQLQSLRALLQQAEGYCLLKGGNASCKNSLIYGQATGLVCNKTVEYPCVVQTCNWTEGHAVGRGGGCGSCVVANFRGLLQAFPGLIGG
jgi:hypothetical protein